MSTETQEIQQVETPAIEVTTAPAPVEQTPAPVPEIPELTYTYQPLDESGLALGGKQVIKYKTPDELATKLTEQNTLLVRQLREVTRKQRLGIVETDSIPESAQLFDAPIEFKPRQLTADERVKISRDLLDPEKCEQASDTLLESRLGVKPETLSNTLNSININNLRLTAKIESDAFVAETPEYHKCQQNFDVMTNWMLKYNLYPSSANFKLAFETLNAAGLLLKAPIVREEPQTVSNPTTTPAKETVTDTPANTQPVQEEPSRITTETPAQTKRPVATIPTGLTRNQASDAGIARNLGDDIVYELVTKDGKGNVTGKQVLKGLAAINAMPADEYRRRVRTENGFAEKAEKLEAQTKRKTLPSNQQQ